MSSNQLNNNSEYSEQPRRHPNHSEASHSSGIPIHLPPSAASDGWRDLYHRNSSITSLSLSSRNHVLFGGSGSSNLGPLNESYRSFIPSNAPSAMMPIQLPSPRASRRPSIFTTVSGSRFYYDGTEVGPMTHARGEGSVDNNLLDDSLQSSAPQRLTYSPSPMPFHHAAPPARWGSSHGGPNHPHVSSEFGEDHVIHAAKPPPKVPMDHHHLPHDPYARHPPPASANVRYAAPPPIHPPSMTHAKLLPPANHHPAAKAALVHHDHPYRSLQSIQYFDHIPPPIPPHYSTRSKKKGMEPLTPDMISAPSRRCLLQTSHNPNEPSNPKRWNMEAKAMRCR
jgi:hypothetical protein